MTRKLSTVHERSATTLKSWIIVASLFMTFTCWAIAAPSSARANPFSSQGFDDTYHNAGIAMTVHNCTGLTQRKLQALALSITWPESTGGNTSASPGPMTMSRSDTESGLYYGGSKTGTYVRAFWHPGVSAFQLDESGLGAYDNYTQFGVDGSSIVVEIEIARRYCINNSQANIFLPWHACDSGACSTIFGNIYDYALDTTKNITRDAAVAEYGGSALRSCHLVGSGTSFNCVKVNPNFAQGDTAWRVPAFGPSPVAYPFYDFTQTVAGVDYEWRVWMNADTGFGSRGMRRTQGANPHTSGVLVSTTSISLCDDTAGVCT